MKVRVFTLLLLLPFVFFLPACNSGLQLAIQTSPGYTVSLFAFGTPSYSHPDGIAVDQGRVFIDYQNDTAKDGSDHKTSTIVEYDMNNRQVLNQFSVSGHSDGLRVDPHTQLLWALSNENANPILTIINPFNGNTVSYTFPPTSHHGGYDDLYFLNGYQYPFISASNPENGASKYPSLYMITHLESGRADVTPILTGNAPAKDVVTGATVTLNEIDPDSLSVDTQGNLVLINEDGNEAVFISHPGTPQQQVSRLAVGTEIDDTVWTPSTHGRLLVVDGVRNQTYWMEIPYQPGTVYTETTGLQGFVEQLDPNTGILTIVASGFMKPTGLLFVPD